MVIKQLTRRIYVEDTGSKKGVFDGGDRLYEESNGTSGYQKGERIVSIGNPQDNMDTFGLENLDGRKIDEVAGYTKLYDRLKELSLNVDRHEGNLEQLKSNFLTKGILLTTEGEDNIALAATIYLSITSKEDVTTRLNLMNEALEIKRSWGIKADQFPSLAPLAKEISAMTNNEDTLAQVDQILTQEAELNQNAKTLQAEEIKSHFNVKAEETLNNTRQTLISSRETLLLQLGERADRLKARSDNRKVPENLSKLCEHLVQAANYTFRKAIADGMSIEEAHAQAKPAREKAVKNLQTFLRTYPNLCCLLAPAALSKITVQLFLTAIRTSPPRT